MRSVWREGERRREAAGFAGKSEAPRIAALAAEGREAELRAALSEGIGGGAVKVWEWVAGDRARRSRRPSEELAERLAAGALDRARRAKGWSGPTVWIWDDESQEAPGWREMALLGARRGDGPGEWDLACARALEEFVCAPMIAKLAGGIALRASLWDWGLPGSEGSRDLQRALDGERPRATDRWLGPQEALEIALGGAIKPRPGKCLEDALLDSGMEGIDFLDAALDSQAPWPEGGREFRLGEALSAAERGWLEAAREAVDGVGSGDLERRGPGNIVAGRVARAMARGKSAPEAILEVRGRSAAGSSLRLALDKLAGAARSAEEAERMDRAAGAAGGAKRPKAL